LLSRRPGDRGRRRHEYHGRRFRILPTGMYILQLNDGEKAAAMKLFIRH
jgi:hypothetical protein